MNKPILSPNFTMEDTHKLREYNYCQTKDMTVQERSNYYNHRGLEVHKIIQERKLQKHNSLYRKSPSNEYKPREGDIFESFLKAV